MFSNPAGEPPTEAQLRESAQCLTLQAQSTGSSDAQESYERVSTFLTFMADQLARYMPNAGN